MILEIILNFVIGIIIVLIVVIIFYNTHQKTKDIKNNGKRTTGVVFRMEYESDTSGGGMGYQVPLIRFVTEDGEWITDKAQGFKYGISKFGEGDKVYVYYDTKNPNEFIIEEM